MGESSPRGEGVATYEPPVDPLIELDGDQESSEPRVYKIVLTGGPCGGKTTALARLSEFFRTNGELMHSQTIP